MLRIRYGCFLLLLFLYCCRAPYNPQIITSHNSYLVVEGLINSGNDSTLIKLSRTVKIGDTVSTVNPELGANVAVESDQNGSWDLYDMNGSGVYGAATLNLPANQKYRLRINTVDGRRYLSDFITPKTTQPVDSVGYYLKNDAVHIYLNTHDPTNNTRYYRWDYQETWSFHSYYESYYVFDPDSMKIIPRPPDKHVYYCWASAQSSSILVNSSAKLSSDVVYQQPIAAVPIYSKKLGDRYSIVVRQYAITAEAYKFYENVLKNSTRLGSIFNAQPSEVPGNIHCLSNPAEPVIGYIGVTNVQSKRIFINGSEFNAEYYTIDDPCGDCMIGPGGNIYTFPAIDIPVFAVDFKNNEFYSSSACCVDCTLRGTNKKPSFWR